MKKSEVRADFDSEALITESERTSKIRVYITDIMVAPESVCLVSIKYISGIIAYNMFKKKL